MNRRSRLARIALPALLFAALPAGASADVFVLKNGTEIDGFPGVRNARKKEITIGTEKGPRTVSEAAIKEVRPSADPAADYAKYLAGLGPKDADGAAALGVWAKGKGLEEPAKEAFRRALSLKADHAVAKEGMGWLKVDGKWLNPDEAEAWRKEDAFRQEIVKKYEGLMGEAPEVVVTPHWRMVDFLGDGKVKQRAEDLERAFAEAVRVLGSEPWKDRGLCVACEGQEQYHLWIDKDAKTLRGFGAQYVEFAKQATGIKWTEPPVLGRSDLPDRVSMHAAVVHSAGHILFNNWKGHNREQPFWLEEGFGGWMEDRVLNSMSSYCFALGKPGGYGSTARDTKDWEVELPDWKGLCRAAAARNEFLPLEKLDELPSSEYSRREVGQAFSLVAFLILEKGMDRFQSFVLSVKKGTASKHAIREAYGQDFNALEPEWRRFLQSGKW
jgi:hypothetical protein